MISELDFNQIVTRNNLSQEEIEMALNIMEQAIENHRAWYAQLHEGLLCKQGFPVTITDVDAHRKCGLGCWFYSHSSDEIRDNPEFKTLEAIHQSMHDKARDLVEKFNLTREVNLQDYRLVSDKQEKLMKSLVTLRDNLINQQHSFDPLTGLINRKSIALILEKNHSYSIRHRTPYSIAMLDIDFFKSVNDNYGHLAGDQVLRVLSDYLSSAFRHSDSVSRYGGEEFLILLPDTGHENALAILEKVCKEISQLCVQYENKEITFTASIGLSDFEGGKSVGEIVHEADSALYRAKESGRNRVVAYQPGS
ncbi:diguanylate cyclase [Methylophaga sp.]|jgi:diguanylate cyclase (GGDEF)-like protein|uniref:diguanylate cyclase n=1 Tax=Methylophaga sp. TaxID=2024840 RepID=UPI0013FF9D72|nr:diguanylate cyclase [Methylophaga sp.]MTI64563.1 diguanylate cyclase [Methylophaga sp.]